MQCRGPLTTFVPLGHPPHVWKKGLEVQQKIQYSDAGPAPTFEKLETEMTTKDGNFTSK